MAAMACVKRSVSECTGIGAGAGAGVAIGIGAGAGAGTGVEAMGIGAGDGAGVGAISSSGIVEGAAFFTAATLACAAADAVPFPCAFTQTSLCPRCQSCI